MPGTVPKAPWLILVLLLPGIAPARAQEPESQPDGATTVAMVLFDGVQIIDYTGPYEVFGQAGFKVFTVAERLDTVVTHMGMQVIPHVDLAQAPKADLIVVPGGGVPHALPRDHPLIVWLLDRQREARYVLSVCNGAFVLAAAGLLDDREATTYAPMISHLSMVAPTVKPVYDQRFVESGNVITAGGLSAGIDAALHIVSRMQGEGRAREVANNMEYNWDPVSTYVRSQLPDLLLAPVLDFNPPLIGRKVLRYEGDETHWVSEYEIPRREAIDAFADEFEKLARSAGWKKIEADASHDAIGATWRFIDHRGQSWTCASLITRGTDQTLVFRLRLTLETTLQDERFLVTEPEWARDGRRIVFAGGIWPDLDVYVLDTDRGEAARVFDGDSTEYMPSFSPDGRRLVFASSRSGSYDLYVGPATGGTATRLTTDDTCDSTEPRWSPQGDWIAYRSDCDGNREVYRIRPDGSDRQRLTHHPDEDSEPSWSADGSRLLFTSYRDGQPEVYAMAAAGSDPVRLTQTPGGHSRRAEWSPDGAWIAFGSNREGNEEIYVMRTDGTEIRNVSRHEAREYYSRWSPDGGLLVFTSNRDRARNALYTTSVDGAEVRRLFPR